jgi:transposase
MAVVPTIAEEDAKRPHRERESLVKERIRTINQMKAILTQFGVCNFKPASRKAPKKILRSFPDFAGKERFAFGEQRTSSPSLA